MKAESILQELEAIKEQLEAQAGGSTRCFLDQMEVWLVEHPHAGPVVNSPQELRMRLRARETTESSPPPEPYRIHDPIIAEIHRIREQLAQEAGNDPHRFFENLRAWSEAHPHPGRAMHHAEELHQYAAEEERKRSEESALVLNDKPPRKD